MDLLIYACVASPFLLEHECLLKLNLMVSVIVEGLSPYGRLRLSPPGSWNVSDELPAHGVPQTELASSKNWEAYTLRAYWTVVTKFYITHILETKHGTCRILKSTWWIYLVRITRVELPSSFGVGRFEEVFSCGKSIAPYIWSYCEVRKVFSHIHQPLYITLGNIHHVLHQYLHERNHREHGWFYTLSLDPIPMQTYSWPQQCKIKPF